MTEAGADSTTHHGAAATTDPEALASRVVETSGTGRPLTLALDYDGTLVPFAPRPPEARADPPLLRILGELAALPETAVAVVSGRSLPGLESALGDPPAGVALFGEHGGVGVVPPGAPFPVFSGDVGWLAEARGVADRASWPEGTWVEAKALALTLHTRGAEEDRAREAREAFRALLAGAGSSVRFLEGHEVLEARSAGLDKGLAIRRLRRAPWSPRAVMVYAGDDRTDEDALSALGPDDVGIRVGTATGETAAAYRLADPGEVRVFLAGVLAGRRRA